MRYELPLDVKRQLQAEGQLEADLSPEALEPYYHEYFQQPVRKVLGAVADSQRTVILGDPGSGKSSLLQYLALEWIEGKTEKLPLLIELREFAINPFANFLEFLHRGRGVDWQFDQQQLHQHLLELPTLVMFDGLDEVFDRTTQLTVIDDIIRFSQQYPKAQVLVTSRIIGYNPDRLQHSGFKHFTIQSLNTGEIHQFIDRWYDLSMGKDPDKMRLKQRLKDAITSSKAIANLADNPLLLTMMAILNRRQELPHDRADLYDQASRVLLYHWDVDHKRLHIPMNTIGRREKQEMLRLIAYEMQVGEEGLKGNLISSDRLTRILTDYLCDQGFSEPREKASLLILQLRERNFILCYRGVDTYGFIHRTFLEYFCAVEIVYRFEKQRTLTFDQLRDEVFGQHCQDETWHEVLRLICNMINAKLANELIDRLMTQKIEKEKFLEIYPGGAKYLRKQGVVNLILAANCLTEIQFNSLTSSTKTNLIKIIQLELKSQNEYILDNETCDELLMGIIKNYHSQEDIRGYLEYCLKLESLVWDGGLMNPLPPSAFRAITKIHSNDSQSDILSWIVRCIQSESNEVIRGEAICELAKNWKKHSETFHLLKKSAQSDSSWHVRYLAIEKLGDNWKNNEETLSIVKEAVEFDEVWQVRFRSMRVLARVWQNDVDTLYFLKQRFKEDNDDAVRSTCIEEVALRWSDDPDTFSFLKTCICCDEYSSWIRAKTISALLDKWIHFSEVFQLCIKVILHDPFVRDEDQGPNPRHIALKGLLTNYPTHPNTIELLRDRAFNDPDGQLQQWAADQLKMRNSEI
ncbi:MAG: HEAT repeat domain-containing protein [Cyanobacteria bacterium P01_E01_bin.6]